MFNLYAVRDKVAQVYLPVFQFKLDGEAMRAFAHEVNRGTGPVHNHPWDYELFYLARFDETSGVVDHNENTRRLCGGEDVIVKGEQAGDDPAW